MFKELAAKTRSYRRFVEDERISPETLDGLLEVVRFVPSGANNQPLRFIPVCKREKCDLVFPTLQWAGRIKDWDGPAEGERPAAYVIILGDTSVAKSFGQDPGIAAYAILLAAADQGIAGCMLGSIDRAKLRADLAIPERYEIALVVALGKAGETVILEDAVDGDVAYRHDEQGRHHVPKLSFDELVIRL